MRLRGAHQHLDGGFAPGLGGKISHQHENGQRGGGDTAVNPNRLRSPSDCRAGPRPVLLIELSKATAVVPVRTPQAADVPGSLPGHIHRTPLTALESPLVRCYLRTAAPGPRNRPED